MVSGHSVKGRLAKTGYWERIAPEVELKTDGWWIFKYTYESPVGGRLSRSRAVEIAQKEFDSGKYQDVMVLRDNGNDDSGNEFCPSCIWENGRWCDYDLNTDLY